jgi:hypothetical protein
MKKAVIISALVLTTVSGAFAQGTVIFNNRIAAVTAHVWAGGITQLQGNSTALPDSPQGATSYGALPLIGAGGTGGQFGASTTFAQLLAAPGSNQAESSLVPALGTTTFRTGAAAGNIVAGTTTLVGVAADAPFATIEMVAWDNSSGLYPTWSLASSAWAAGTIAAGRSAAFNVAGIGGQANPAPTLDAIRSFNIYSVPEPTTMALAGLGAAALVIFRRRNK